MSEVHNQEITFIELVDKASPKLFGDDVSISSVGDLFDFEALLTTVPSAAEGRYIGDCESKVYVQTRLLHDGKTFDDLAVDPNNPNTDDAVSFTAIALAESGGISRSHAPHGEERGLWQINIDPAQTDDRDTFDCSGLVQWASVATETFNDSFVFGEMHAHTGGTLPVNIAMADLDNGGGYDPPVIFTANPTSAAHDDLIAVVDNAGGDGSVRFLVDSQPTTVWHADGTTHTDWLLS